MARATNYANCTDREARNKPLDATLEADLHGVAPYASGWIDGVLSPEHMFYCARWQYWTLRDVERMEKAFDADRLLADSEEALDEIDLILSVIHVLLPVWREVFGE